MREQTLTKRHSKDISGRRENLRWKKEWKMKKMMTVGKSRHSQNRIYKKTNVSCVVNRILSVLKPLYDLRES